MPDPSLYNSPEIPFTELQSVDSTNNYARWLIETANVPDKQGVIKAVFAHEQTAGKGQRNRTWISDKKANILLSLIADPSALSATNMFPLSAFTAVMVNDFFSKYAGDETRIKWPNDIYWKDRKAGGILIENIIGSGESSLGKPAIWKWSIIGIGININQTRFGEGTGIPVSLKQITGKDFDPVLLAKELVHEFDSSFHKINAEFDKIHNAYLSNLYKKDELVKLKKGSRVFQTTIKSVSPQGKLITTEEEFGFGEVEFV